MTDETQIAEDNRNLFHKGWDAAGDAINSVRNGLNNGFNGVQEATSAISDEDRQVYFTRNEEIHEKINALSPEERAQYNEIASLQMRGGLNTLFGGVAPAGAGADVVAYVIYENTKDLQGLTVSGTIDQAKNFAANLGEGGDEVGGAWEKFNEKRKEIWNNDKGNIVGKLVLTAKEFFISSYEGIVDMFSDVKEHTAKDIIVQRSQRISEQMQDLGYKTDFASYTQALVIREAGKAVNKETKMDLNFTDYDIANARVGDQQTAQEQGDTKQTAEDVARQEADKVTPDEQLEVKDGDKVALDNTLPRQNQREQTVGVAT